MMMMMMRADDDDVQLEETISCVQFKRLVQFSNRPALTDLRISRRYSPSKPHGAFFSGTFCSMEKTKRVYRRIFQRDFSAGLELGG
ncbi:unnamed protein product [Sphagnum jensenii]|uniref:Uncharacterized protein n=1 Tax=Sphagnum jensenii TaxID=128206 RepID=A0ABP1BZC9_9BRYO